MLWTYIDLAAAPLEQKKAAEMQSLQFKPNELEGYIHKKNTKKQVFQAEAAVNAHTPKLSFSSADKCYRGQVQSNFVTFGYVAVTRSTTNAACSKTSSAPRSRGHRHWPRVQSRSRGQRTMHPGAAVKRGQFAVTRFCNSSSIAFSARTTQS